MSSISAADIEKMAKTLATNAGVYWDSLPDYPGFERGRWRNEAKKVLKRQVAEQEQPVRAMH